MSLDLRLILPFEVSNNNYNGRKYFASGGSTRYEKYALGSFDDRDMMTRSKALASEPCNEKSSHQRLDNQMHKVSVHLNPNSKVSRKRKFDRYINDGKFGTTFDLVGKEKYGNVNDKVHKRSKTSFLSCSALFEEKSDISQGIQEHVDFPALNDETEYCRICMEDYSHLSDSAVNDDAEYCRICTEDYSHLSDSDDSIKGINPMNQASVKSQHKDLMASSSYTFSTKTSVREKPKIEFDKVLKLVNEDFFGSQTSPSLSSKEEDIELIHPNKNFLPSRGNHLPRPIIPLGPRFQAEVPKWEDISNMKHYNSYDGSKWLGTQIWPMPIRSNTNTKGIGNGRPESCLCDFPGSIDCVRKHVSEARKLLKWEIGTAFVSWKFDDMGEDVSKSWTLEEQKQFESLVKLNPLSNDTNFWELAMEHFPSKSMKCMVNYYFNVYIPRRMSMETRTRSFLVQLIVNQKENYKIEHHLKMVKLVLN